MYEICLLNRYSNAQKSVYLGLYSESADETWPFNHREQVEDKVDEAEIIMDMASSEIIVSLAMPQHIVYCILLEACLFLLQFT